MKNGGNAGLSQGLSEWMEERCRNEKLSLRGAAGRTGLSHATIAEIIKGVSPTPESIRKLAHGFGGNGKEGLALEDHLLTLAGYRTERPAGQEISPPMGRLLDSVAGFDDSQLVLMSRFAEFLAGRENEAKKR